MQDELADEKGALGALTLVTRNSILALSPAFAHDDGRTSK
jgi:hypothetical protein